MAGGGGQQSHLLTNRDHDCLVRLKSNFVKLEGGANCLFQLHKHLLTVIGDVS